jgi:L-alanine-DL-glutamate epimerase-like enolase superfamily enzyme
MRIARVDLEVLDVPLARPYAIAFHATDAVQMARVRIVAENGLEGHGSATPAEEVTGETFTACVAAMAVRESLVGRDTDELPRLLEEIAAATRGAPAARAAIDMALHDLWAKMKGKPLVEILGRAQRSLETSITIGIKPLDETLGEAQEYLARGFKALKVKIGESFDADVERLVRLRESVGASIAIRADANVGYPPETIERFFTAAARARVEFLEQPAPREHDAQLRRQPQSIRRRLAADESLHDEADALELARAPQPYGIWNIKLMKCGGIAPALRIARIAHANGIELMWGCMDESVIGIAAALHAAYACAATRTLDLDGSFDLARDPACGGFALSQGRLDTLDAPGLGAELSA